MTSKRTRDEATGPDTEPSSDAQDSAARGRVARGQAVDDDPADQAAEHDDENQGDDADETLVGEDAEFEDDGEGEAEASETEGEGYNAPASVESSPNSIARLDAMAAYMREVQRHPRLTHEETHQLAVEFHESQDPAIAARLVTSNLRLVVKIAYEYRRAYKNIMDLVQEGNIGLMQAVKHYDPFRGVKLSSYSAMWIRAYILRFLLNNSRLVKLGTTQAQRKLFYNLNKTRAELQAKGIDPTHADIAQALNVPEQDVLEMDMRLSGEDKSLDAPVGDADGRAISRVDLMPSADVGPEVEAEDNQLSALLRLRLAEFRKTLLDREKELAIFDERLVADEALTLQELGDRFGVSRERVRQLEQRVKSRLRDYLRREIGDGVEVFD